MNRARRGLLPALLLLGAGSAAAPTLAQRIEGFEAQRDLAASTDFPAGE